jgi:purine-binding chemotaxis protein CheW
MLTNQAQSNTRLVIFLLDGMHFALYLHAVERVVPAVEITLLPGAPDIVFGVINIRGRVIPVVNIRRRFGLPDRKLSLKDHFVLASTGELSVAVITDNVKGVIEYRTDGITYSNKILPDLKYVDGVITLDDGLVLIHDLGRLLSLSEQESLEQTLYQANH